MNTYHGLQRSCHHRQRDRPTAGFRLILLLCSVPGINVLGATIILAEIGREMSRFPTAGHLLALPGCVRARTRVPANGNPRACAKARPGSRPSSCNAPGQPRARRTATTGRNSSGFVPSGTEESHLCRRRLDAHRDHHMLKDGTHHQDLGADHFGIGSNEAKARHHVAQLARLGFRVELQPAAQVA